MLVVKIEEVHAVTGRVTLIEEIHVCNVGRPTEDSPEGLRRYEVYRHAQVQGHTRTPDGVTTHFRQDGAARLVAKALTATGGVR